MKRFSLDRNQIVVLITLLVVIFLAASYFFIYLPGNELTIQKQRFRTLQNVDVNIHSKIDNNVALLNNLLSAYFRRDIDTSQINHYIKTYPSKNFRLYQISPTNKPGSSVLSDSVAVVQVDTVTNRFDLSLIKQSPNLAWYKMGMKFSFSQFISDLLPPSIFDQYIIYSKGKVVYQTFPSGINAVNPDSVQAVKNGINSQGIKALSINGLEYKMFVQEVDLGFGKKWVITGLVDERRYQHEKSQLPSGLVLAMLTLAVGMLLFFPVLKLYQMGSNDRLTVRDGVSAIVVAMLLMSLVFFAFIKYNVRLRPDIAPNSKENIANGLSSAFDYELKKAYETMLALDQLHNHSTFNLRNIRSDSISPGTAYYRKKDTVTDAFLQSVKKETAKVKIAQIFWLNKKGDEISNWNAATMNAPLNNFANREYFKEVISDIQQPPIAYKNKRFFIEPVVSRTTGTFTTVISTRSAFGTDRNPVVVAMSFKMTDLEKAVLPLGYQYAVIDRNGKVQYHSDPSKNLNENLLDEFSESKRLLSSLQANNQDDFTTQYFNNEYNILFRPLKNLPFYLVIMGDTVHKETRDMEVYCFTTALMFSAFLFLSLQLIAIFVISSRRSFFKKQLFDTSWVGPKINSHLEYVLASLAYLFLIIMLGLFSRIASVLTYLFILLFTVTFVGIILNSLFAARYKQLQNLTNYAYKVLSLRWLIVFVVVMDIIALTQLTVWHFAVMLVFEAISALSLIVLLRWRLTIADDLRRVFGERIVSGVSYTGSFALMSLLRLIITSGIPVFFFYIIAYNYEQNLSTRYRHVQFAEKLKAAGLMNQSLEGKIGKQVFTDNSWIKTVRPVIAKDIRSENNQGDSLEDLRTSNFLNLFRFYQNDQAANIAHFNTSASSDSSYVFNRIFKSALTGNGGTVTYYKTGIGDTLLRISSFDLSYKLPTFFSLKPMVSLKGFLYWTLLLIALCGFYVFVYSVLQQLFAYNLPKLERWNDIDEQVLKDNRLNKLMFIIGLPGSGKLKYLTDHISNGTIKGPSGEDLRLNGDENQNVFIFDVINIPDSEEERKGSRSWIDLLKKLFSNKNKMIILNHFEYNIQDAATNRVKLNILEQLMLSNIGKVIILSTVHPIAFLDSVNEQAAIAGSFAGNDLERWHVLFGHFHTMLIPLKTDYIESEENWEKVIFRETEYTHFLNDLRPAVLKAATDMHPNGELQQIDELAFKLQFNAHYFYMYIWQSLTKEEKFLLYDLAEDGLVNSFDDYNLSMLISKGVVIRVEGTLRVFNKGFRNFILTAIGNSEAAKIKKLMLDNGNWNKLKTPLIVVVIAILGFLLASQQQTYSRVITYITAFAAGVPTLLKLFSVFDKKTDT
ncbi:hypothetical protein GS399_02470 [Pedobacter sp. HMF7647]|uniref:Uncharacterized protein n=1 Tax=Hufsiella arboris TaxID=2695275 RepID=A0A7K1Y6R9_9SPHI|nr:cache domain-containing protein [Hufsiella arboris]MXV49819.1 hypothetical protein [Hufsiella arboris]